jgi:DNA modification methylase
MQVSHPDNLLHELRRTSDASLDFIVLGSETVPCLDECVRTLRDGGLLFIRGRPESLPEIGVYLDGRLTFKYWIAVESTLKPRRGLPSVHSAVLLFCKGTKFDINRVRFAHKYCAFCGKTLKDWGGKTHLMHPEGSAISDVWTDCDALDRIMRMVPDGVGIVGPERAIVPRTCDVLPNSQAANVLPSEMVNIVHCGDAIQTLKCYPDNCIDLAFADPPYNLKKLYSACDDSWDEPKYLEWCNEWLAEYVRVLKPTGSLYVLNLPRWAMHHAAFLNTHLCFQNWIVWDALSEPMGKLMPAHYALLFYTKHPTDFTFNYDHLAEIDSRGYCLRAACTRKRKAEGADKKEPLTDIWHDIHRIKHRRDRDYHPCQLPDALMERIISLSANEGDVVLDALSGTGTTAVTAARLGRRYVAIDLDEGYVALTRKKIAEVERQGFVQRTSIEKPKLEFTKKELQLELRDLALRLGRLPTPEDVHNPDVFLTMFPTWGKALKAAKLEVGAS